MPKQDKTPKKKSKKKSPQKSGESEYPAMDQDEMNRLLQNAIEQIKAEKLFWTEGVWSMLWCRT